MIDHSWQLPTKCIHWLTNLNFSKVISVNIYNSHFLYNQVNESHQVQIHKIIWIVQTHNKQTAMMTVLHHHILVNYTKLEDHYVIKKVKVNQGTSKLYYKSFLHSCNIPMEKGILK
jgi:hypothetical protein